METIIVAEIPILACLSCLSVKLHSY